jgi:hypothetical protein
MLSRKNSAFVVCLLLAAGMVGYYFRIFLPRARATRAVLHITFFYGEDLYPYWLGTREVLAHHVSPYSQQVTRQIQVAVYGRPLDPQSPFERDQHRFSYPLYVVLPMASLAWLPFPWIRLAGAFLLPLLTLLAMVLWDRAFQVGLSRRELVLVGILALTSYALLSAQVAQQLSLVVFFALAACVWCIARQKLVLAGILLGLSSIKPQLVLPSTLFLLLWSMSIWQERKTLLWSFVLTLGSFLAVSLWLLPSWPAEWLRTIVDYRDYTVPPLAPFLLGGLVGNILSCSLLLLSALFCWKARRDSLTSRGFALAMAFTLAATIVTIPTGDSVYDHIFLIPGLLILISGCPDIVNRSGISRALGLTAAVVFGWQWITGTLLFLFDVIWPGLIRSSYVLSAPLRTQPAMPFVVLALLGLNIPTLLKRTPQPSVHPDPLLLAPKSFVN